MRREWAIAAAVGVGAILRGGAYARSPSLWLDEAMLSLNVAERSFGALAQPLDLSQVAPIPFLWLLKLATLLGGVNELSLRIVPLLAGIGLLGLQWWVARRFLGSSAGLAAVTLAAISPILLHYSYEVKQYELDALVALGVMALVVSVLDAPRRAALWAWLGIGGATALAISQPSVFVLTGAMGALLLDSAVRTTPGWARRVCGIAVLWLVVFTALHVLVYRRSTNAQLYAVWSETFLTPGSPDFMNRLMRAGSTALTLALPTVVADQSAWLVGTVCLLGLALVWDRRGLAGLAVVLGPFGAVLAAAVTGKYPLGARVLAFTTPLWILAYAAVLAWVGRAVPRRVLPYAWGASLVGFGAVALCGGAGDPWSIPVKEDARTVIEWVDARRGDDPVYVLQDGLPTWSFYTIDWERPDLARLSRIRHAASRTSQDLVQLSQPAYDAVPNTGQAARRIDLLGSGSNAKWREGRGWVEAQKDERWAADEAARIRVATNGRVWIVASHFRPDQLRSLIAGLRALGGSVVQAHVAAGAEAYHLRFQAVASTQPTAGRPSGAARGHDMPVTRLPIRP